MLHRRLLELQSQLPGFAHDAGAVRFILASWRQNGWHWPQGASSDTLLSWQPLVEDCRSSTIAVAGTRIVFWAPDFASAVGLELPKKISKSSRARCLALFERFLEAFNHRFDASHNSVSGLPDRRRFQKEVDEAVRNAQQSYESSVARSPSSVQAISLIAIDIDHFKRVNDAYGHQYGDLVLRALGGVLEEFCRSTKHGDVILSPGHPSGEEFLILIKGAHDKKKAILLADDLRSTIENSDLPSRAFLESAGNAALVGKLARTPIERERRITISLGTATTSSTSQYDYHTLRELADAALYRAKAAGRNRVCHADDIKRAHGQVLEHHEQMDIVAVDIGASALVQAGDEFLAYHSDFNGSKDFEVDDGRSRRAIGKYPKLWLARLVVTDVQKDISFCRVHARRSNHPVPRGATLEFVLPGDVRHLLDVRVTAKVTGIEDAYKAMLRAAARTKPLLVVGVFGYEELRLHRGNAEAADAVVAAMSAVRARGDTPLRISEVLTAFIPGAGTAPAAIAREVLDYLKQVAERFRYYVGYCPWDAHRSDPKNHKRLVVDDAVLAAEVASLSPDTIRNCDSNGLAELAQHYRHQKMVDRASQMYSTMKSLSLNTKENVQAVVAIALCLWESSQSADKYLPLLREAHAMSSGGMYTSNLALALSELGRYREAVDCFALVWKEAKKKEDRVMSTYGLAFATAVGHALPDLADVIDGVSVRELSQTSWTILNADAGGESFAWTPSDEHKKTALANLKARLQAK